MIGFLEGELLDKTTGQALVKVGGVGYLVLIPLSTFYALPEAPAPVSLQIHTRIQDEALNLYGFATHEEKDLFLKLLNIPRIGPGLGGKLLLQAPAGALDGQALAVEHGLDSLQQGQVLVGVQALALARAHGLELREFAP